MGGWGEDRGRRRTDHVEAPGRRASDDDGVPYQLAVACQELLEAILGDDVTDLEELGPLLAVIAEASSAGHPEPWTKDRVLARLQELSDLYAGDVWVCRLCGCTDLEACDGGCWWVEDPVSRGPLCSSCLAAVKAERSGLQAVGA